MAVRGGAAMVGFGPAVEGAAEMARDAEGARWQQGLFDWFEAHADPDTDKVQVDRLGWLELVRSLRRDG